ncbi:MAG: pilus assembly protein N-terminal domain-containing protein [Candidatus Omnitrophica bacterium]|nr:pilus assembly protein N-terminal domain-containing protein [Candidatus Omnitrophota bacterium]
MFKKNLILLSMFLLAMAPSKAVFPQDPALPENNADIKEIRQLKWPQPEDKTETLTIFRSTSQILRFDRPLKRVAVSNSSVCNLTTLGSQEILLYCPRTGKIDLIVWDSSLQTAVYYIQSVIDYPKLEEILRHIDPKANIKVIPYEGTVAVYGSSETAEKVKQIADATKAFNNRAISYVKIDKPKQILLEVRFAEIDRRASRTFGFDGETISRFIVTRSFTGEAHSGTTVDADNAFTPRGGAAAIRQLVGPDPAKANAYFSYVNRSALIQGNLKWLVTKNILKLIARPNLIALDGQLANFVVGGETPFITSTVTSANVTFKEFGTKLSFTPNVGDHGVIRLSMKVELSELDFSSTVSLQGTTVPTIIKTSHQTIAELKDNQTLVVGGLINQRINRVEKKFPILGDIPGLDRLFKRLEFSRKDIELLIVVTPHLIEPFDNRQKKDLYPPEEVEKSTGIYVPAYPDDHADRMNRLMVQEEDYNDFDGFEWKRAKELEKEFVTIKSTEKAELKRKQTAEAQKKKAAQSAKQQEAAAQRRKKAMDQKLEQAATVPIVPAHP